jgi:Sigma-70 region 2
MRPSKEQMHNLYRCLLTGEPDAPSIFIEALLDPLIEALNTRFPNLSDPNLIIDTVTDTLLKFVQAPEHYQPERGSSLWSYLYMDVLGDLRNALAKEKRRQAKVVAFDPVAHDRPDGNINLEEEVLQRLEVSSLPSGTDVETVVNQLRTAIADSHDWQVVLLMFSGERRTAVFAAVLGIEHLPIQEQRKRVKQAKDRLRLQLKRYGVKIHGK